MFCNNVSFTIIYSLPLNRLFNQRTRDCFNERIVSGVGRLGTAGVGKLWLESVEYEQDEEHVATARTGVSYTTLHM